MNARLPLTVQVRAGDLRFVDLPLLVGHYEQDPIAGPQALIDRDLLAGGLSERHRLGLYAGPIGSATVVLQGLPGADPAAAPLMRGAIVTGLGPYDGSLGTRELTEAVRTGVLRLLLQVRDQFGPAPRAFALGSLLLGGNSSTTLGLESVIESLVRGVLQASQRFAEIAGTALRIDRLELVELYSDIALSAVRALHRLAPRLDEAARQAGCTLHCDPMLIEGEGRRPRLSAEAGSGGYWPRLLISAGPEGSLNFLHLGARARAEAIGQPLQAGLLEALLRPPRPGEGPGWDHDLGRTLFHLLVPPDFRETVRQLRRAVLVVDERSAAIPWELLVTEELVEQPLALSLALPMVRQLGSHRFRRQVRRSPGRAALVIGDPSTEGAAVALAPLPEAEQEARKIHDVLRDCGHEPVLLTGTAASAPQVLRQLYGQPLHIVHISAHGLSEEGPGGRTGVVLSSGLMLTAIEIGAMDPVPELVFLNCCHLGHIDGRISLPQRAASLAQTLIDSGVRCVIAAGWSVSDTGAALFGTTFYRELLEHGRPFGDAVFEARRVTRDGTTESDLSWGAFQAYGDPAWQVADHTDDASEPPPHPPALHGSDELLDELRTLRIGLRRRRPLQPPQRSEIEAHIAQLRTLIGRAPPPCLDQPTVLAELIRTWAELDSAEQAVAQLRQALRGQAGSKLLLQASERLDELHWLARALGEAEDGERHQAFSRSLQALQALLSPHLPGAVSAPKARSSSPRGVRKAADTCG
ncbi:MAG: hypothetical protein QG612_597 [Pseudomonadota bacterium]|nr:hypothetical protein [Pseudomonadota bacterium]